MVLEQLYPAKLLLRKPWLMFLLGACSAVIGLGLALLLFPKDPSLIAGAITSLLLLPSFGQLSAREERIERKKGLFADIFPFLRLYLAAFFGIFIVFVLFSLILPSLTSNILFRNQLDILLGAATFSAPLFLDILANNVLVFFLCFFLSLVAGNGAIFLIAWNASVWGTIFGNLAKVAALTSGQSAIFLLGTILLTVLPHVLLEIFGYISSVSAGTTISDGLVKEKYGSIAFYNILRRNVGVLFLGLFSLVVGVGVEVFVLLNIPAYMNIARLAFGG